MFDLFFNNIYFEPNSSIRTIAKVIICCRLDQMANIHAPTEVKRSKLEVYVSFNDFGHTRMSSVNLICRDELDSKQYSREPGSHKVFIFRVS